MAPTVFGFRGVRDSIAPSCLPFLACFIFDLFANLRHLSMAPPPVDEHNLYINWAPSVLSVRGVPGASGDDANWGLNQKKYFDFFFCLNGWGLQGRVAPVLVAVAV